MINIITRLFLAATVILPHTVTAQTGLESDQQKFSYAIGIQVGQNVVQQGMNIDPDALLLGISDAVNQQGLKLTMEEMQTAISNFQAQEQERLGKIGEENRIAGEKFLEENKSKRDVTELASGLQYMVLSEGDGEQPDVTDTVIVHYRGSLIDGTEFDSSYGRGEPLPVPLEGVIEGWQVALPLMKVGSEWRIFIPSSLGYGENSAGNMIGPNSTLIFDIELLGIEE